MRAQSGGYIINISSGNASIRLPFMGHYTATKCALEGFSEILRQEVRPFGVQVSAIEPPFLKSYISETNQLGKDLIEQYEPLRTRWIDIIRGEVRNGADPIVIARCIMRILMSKRPRFMYVPGSEARLGIWIHRWLPENISQWIFRTRYGVKST
jgi:NAD(P)-dependent dehydrogenase (short-subunit alcohol dehydrogenase family)